MLLSISAKLSTQMNINWHVWK